MKLSVSFVAIATTLLVARETTAQTIVYNFDPLLGAGVDGNIKIAYLEPNCPKAKITAELDFSKVDQKALRRHEASCTSDVVEYKWHMHVSWSSLNGTESFDQCGKHHTGNHFDPRHACGPASEHADSHHCKKKSENYECTPDIYRKEYKKCEKGDLSGKFGDLKLNADKKVTAEWQDDHYPKFAKNKPEWNIVLHAVCGSESPRIACAVGRQVMQSPQEASDY